LAARAEEKLAKDEGHAVREPKTAKVKGVPHLRIFIGSI
jgi:hypothetical protein